MLACNTWMATCSMLILPNHGSLTSLSRLYFKDCTRTIPFAFSAVRYMEFGGPKTAKLLFKPERGSTDRTLANWLHLRSLAVCGLNYDDFAGDLAACLKARQDR